MHRTSLWRSTSFRVALAFAFLFILAFVLSGGIAYQLMSARLSSRLDDSVRQTYSVVAAAYADKDVEDLVSAVDSHANTGSGKDQLFSLTAPSGLHLAGNFTASGLPLGFSTLEGGTPSVPADADYRAFSGVVGDNDLTVALSYSEIDELEAIVLASFGWATVIISGLAVAGGGFLASRIQRRLDAIAATMVDVSHGRLGVRIPLIGNGDDIDAVSGQVNAALDRLSALVEGMRQVSSDIAHDLKSPLNRLQMILESAGERAATGNDVAADLVDARAESGQINETFDALLRIAQIEAGARKARFLRLNLLDVMASIAEIYAGVAEDDGKSLVMVQPAVSDAWVRGDRELLTQMFANLVENALRHCPAGTLVNLAVSRRDGAILAEVSDNGPGIPAAEREKVFRRLYRLDKSRTTPGTGLGLSLVRAIADLHGATIRLDDRAPGLGVVVSFAAAGPGE